MTKRARSKTARGAATTSTASRGVRVTPRLPDFAFDDADIPRQWHSGSVGITSFWNVFLLAGPAIESFFLRDAQSLLPLVRDPGLREEFRSFMVQEAYHSKVHQRVFGLFERWGYPVAGMNDFARRLLRLVERTTNTKLRSAIVVAGEHFLGELGHQVITNLDCLAAADRRIARLLEWHCYEEIEHKAVCFDAFTDAYGDTAATYLHRVAGLAYAILALCVLLPVLDYRFMRAEGGGMSWAEWKKLGAHLFGRRGIWRGIGASIAAFLDPRFHPWRFHDDSSHLAARADIVKEEWALAASPPAR